MLDSFEAKWTIVKNGNITVDHFGSKGLHLISHGIAKFAMNLKVSIRKLWTRYGNSVHTWYQHLTAKNTPLLIVTMPTKMIILHIWIF